MSLRRFWPRLLGRAGSPVALGLAGVVVVLSSLALAAVLIGRQQARETLVASRLAAAYENVRHAADQEELLSHKYQLAPSADALAGFHAAAAEATAALGTAAALESEGEDQAAIGRAVDLNDQYVAAVARLFVAVDARDREQADEIERVSADPLFDSLRSTISSLAQRRFDISVSRLAGLETLSAAVAIAAPVALAIGVLLIGLFWRELRRVAARERWALAAQTASRTKSAFLASMSHELRTPLNAILGFSQLVLESNEVGERNRAYLEHVSVASRRLLHLVNDVLEIANIESGISEQRPETTLLSRLLEPVSISVKQRAEAKGLAFAVEAPADPFVTVDPAHVRQVLANLLSNAVKFTPPPGSVTLRARAEDGGLVFEVADTGPGIPPADQERVLEPFVRLQADSADAFGPGLGLALVKRLVALEGGTITLESAVGVGSTFRVRLPNATPVVPDDVQLLVVEDEPGSSELVRSLAREKGLRVGVARTVADALAAIDRMVPLGVVLDLRLPDGRGEQILAALRKLPTRVPVAIVTVESPGTPALDVDEFMTKPLDSARLRVWLAGVARAQEGAHADTPG